MTSREEAQIPSMHRACRAYMERFGLFDCEATRAQLADVLEIPRRIIDTFSRYGNLGVLAEDGRPA